MVRFFLQCDGGALFSERQSVLSTKRDLCNLRGLCSASQVTTAATAAAVERSPGMSIFGKHSQIRG